MKRKQLAALLLSVLLLTACQKVDTIDPVPDRLDFDSMVELPAEDARQEVVKRDPVEPEGEQTPDVPDASMEGLPPDEPVVVTRYSGNDNADGFVTTQAVLEALTPEALFALLTEAGSIPEQTVCISFAQSEDGRTLTLDVSRQFADGIMQMGTAGETMMLGSLVNTFLSAYGAEELILSVEGLPLETGHNVYDFPLGFFGQGNGLCGYPTAP